MGVVPNTPNNAAANVELRALLNELMPRHRERWGDSAEWDALVDFQRSLSTHGWTAPAWPVEVGGRGLDTEAQIACDLEFRRAGAPTRPSVYGVNNVGPTILAVGNEAQQAHARAIVEATEFWCQGFSEPDHGSDLGSLACRADIDGDEFVINGSKIWTSIGLHASHCMLLVRTDQDARKHKGISALLVDLDTAGVQRQPIKQMNGESEFAELFFTDVRVPTSALLGPLNEGWRVTMATLGFERAGVISMAGDLAERTDTAIRSVASSASLDPVVRDEGMQLWSRARILGWLGERSLAESDDGAPDASGSIIKLAWSLLSRDLGEFGVQASGAAAMLDGGAVPELLMGRASTIAGGTTEVVKNILGERALGLPKEPSPTQ